MSTEISIDELFELARDVDLFAAIDRLYADPEPERAAQLFGKLAKRFYSELKSVARASAVARAGIQYCLSRGGSEEQRSLLRQRAKALAFNLAADCWPGWGDEGIVITPSDLELGLDAGRLNARLALELGKGPLAESKAHWLLGALLLAQRQREQAQEEFALARQRARAAESADDERLNAGYEALTDVLRGAAGARERLGQVVQELSAPGASDDARFYAQQLQTALQIFERQ